MVAQQWNTPNATELYTLGGLRWKTLCSLYFIMIFEKRIIKDQQILSKKLESFCFGLIASSSTFHLYPGSHIHVCIMPFEPKDNSVK